MHTAEIEFRVETESDREATAEAASSLLAAWRKNGQVLGKVWPMVSSDEGIRVYVSLPESGSLDSRFSNQYVAQATSKFEMDDLPLPQINVLGPDPESAAKCTCPGRQSMILFTNYLTAESPLRCGDCFGPIPLYRVPPTSSDEFWDLLSWESDYKACDTLQMGCTTGERFGMRQISDPDSPLSRQGREFASKIESSTSTPTYYYLHKSNGRSLATERKRRCPGCDGGWVLNLQLHGLFDFQCNHCRLLSNLACNVT